MANIVLDPAKGKEAADTLVSVLNGSAQESIVTLYSIVKTLGEGLPIVDAPVADLKKAEAYFNEEFAPAARKLQDHFMEFTDLATYMNNLQAATVADGEEVGSIADTTYDAAMHL